MQRSQGTLNSQSLYTDTDFLLQTSSLLDGEQRHTCTLTCPSVSLSW